jgi:uncharacterized protein involved in cysteine biosynthesis
VASVTKASFGVGVRAFWAGTKFVIGRPANWPLAAVPALIAAFAMVAVSVGACRFGWSLLDSYEAPNHLDVQTEPLKVAGYFLIQVLLLRGLVALVALVLGVTMGLTLAQPLSGFALDRLARRKEEALGLASSPELGSGFFRTVRVTVFALLVTVPLLGLLSLLTLVFPPVAIVTVPLKITISSFAVAWDLLDYPLAFRGLGVRQRIRFCSQNRASVFALGLLASISLLVPGLGILLLPIGVCGATELVCELEHASSARELNGPFD